MGCQEAGIAAVITKSLSCSYRHDMARKPQHSSLGRSARQPLWIDRVSYRIGVAISPLNDTTMPVADPGSQPPCGGNIEAPARTDSDPPDMHTGILPLRHDRPHQIAGTEAKVDLLSWHMAHRKAVLVRPAHLPRSVGRAGDQLH